MTDLKKKYRFYNPEPIGETNRTEDDSHYIDWLEKEIEIGKEKLQAIINNCKITYVSDKGEKSFNEIQEILNTLI